MLIFDQDTPVLFLVFNRPGPTEKVFEAIKLAAPKRLYIAADGARNEKESERCSEVRSIVARVNWDCEVKTLFREENLGCGRAVSGAIKWFFDHEECGIILEDDCLPVPSFFAFCSQMLKYYNDDERIGHISGSNFQNGKLRGDGSYYFSSLPHIWGWAGWRRVWKDYDFELTSFPKFDTSFTAFPAHQPFAEKWQDNLNKIYHGEIDTWDFQYAYLNLVMGYKAVMPNVNLVINIGIGPDATHTTDSHPFENNPTGNIREIIHPTFKIQDVAADIYTLQLEFQEPEVKKKSLLSRVWKTIRNR